MNNINGVYTKLAKHLDKLPGGYPPTDSGVELRILKRLFSEDEAELALHLTLIPEEAKVVARRAKLPTAEAARRLKEMARKGLIFSIELKNRPALFMASQFVVGIWEYHVNDLDPGLIADMRQYIPYLFDKEAWSKSPQLRTIPVGRALPAGAEILDYESAEELIKRQKHILVAPCICRKEHQIAGDGCDRPLETCLVFGAGVFYYERNGLGRRIDVDECLEILKIADKAGLVLQPSNTKKIINICCCCGDCCHVLKTIASFPRPADIAASPFIARADSSQCSGCGVCVDRCQMGALGLDDDELVVLQEHRCIGCGLCVSTCPTGGLSLERKPADQQKPVPNNIIQMSRNLARARGKLNPAGEVVMLLKSKVDRLLARS